MENNVVDIEELWMAEQDCARRKRSSTACDEFMINEAANVAKLWKELNDGTYEIGYSTAFVVTRPKLREVFAADFRDRIAHHYVINRTINLFESHFIEDSYNCRKGKGTTYAIKRIDEQIRQISNNFTTDCWILKCDIKNFFMSINKNILWKMLEKFLMENYQGDDKAFVLSLTKQIVMHRPELKCIRHGTNDLWDALDTGKSLFNSLPYKGLAIGNLTSQIFANFYLSYFDKWIISKPGLGYGRYVDDFIVLAKTKEELLSLIHEIRAYLKDNLELQLHPKKFYLQHYTKGVKFTGYVWKMNRIYTSNRTVNNAIMMVREWNMHPGLPGIERYIQRYNSFMGFLLYTCSYNIRKRIWEMLDAKIKELIYIDKDYKAVHIKDRFNRINLRANAIRNHKHRKRKLRSVKKNSR